MFSIHGASRLNGTRKPQTIGSYAVVMKTENEAL